MEFSGRLATPTAILECFAISPKISTSRSDAALITLGCSEKSEVEFTNPEIFTIFVMHSSEPKYEFSCDKPLIIHNWAAAWADSTDCSVGTFPENTKTLPNAYITATGRIVADPGLALLNQYIDVEGGSLLASELKANYNLNPGATFKQASGGSQVFCGTMKRKIKYIFYGSIVNRLCECIINHRDYIIDFS